MNLTKDNKEEKEKISISAFMVLDAKAQYQSGQIKELEQRINKLENVVQQMIDYINNPPNHLGQESTPMAEPSTPEGFASSLPVEKKKNFLGF